MEKRFLPLCTPRLVLCCSRPENQSGMADILAALPPVCQQHDTPSLCHRRTASVLPPKSRPQYEGPPKLGRRPDLEWHRCGVRWWHRPRWACTYICTYAAPGGPAPLTADAAIHAVQLCRTGTWRRSALLWVHSGSLSGAKYAAPCLSELLSPRAIDTAAAGRSGSASTLHGRPCAQGLS